jgi:SulP family sulfate permease
MVDGTGAGRLKVFIEQSRRNGSAVILSGLQPQPLDVLRHMDVIGKDVHLTDNFAAAVDLSRTLVSVPAP